ncbi:MAG: helix-turn-helix domain-containing protein [Myxococcota bacterium]|nr:helix-turn-helix domain-containing protein [Deltaproteobacteria bacterium]MDQ3334544.1 helix-turn-helix domain-containing protein [Myxococcota bacterium]
MSLALWLRTGRTERKLSLGDVARITKIQPRILERLEGGNLDGLPAEVFVRGFIRSFAKCCGLDEAEAVTRFSAASQAQAIATKPTIAGAMPGALGAPPAARAMVDAMSELAPQIARTTSQRIEVVELACGSLNAIPVEVTEIAPEASIESAKSNKKKQRGKKRSKRGTQRSEMATGTPSTPTPVVVEAVVVDVAAPVVADAAPVEVVAEAVVVDHLDPLVEPTDANEDIVATETWQPKMPAATPAATVPWRRPYTAMSSAAASVPTLVIDDADPDAAAQVVEDREAARSVLTNAQRRSFLPPILLDREDRSARQGGLTLAVIILLIAATLTLSYLMRRPSSSGDGVTMNAADETSLVG